MIKRLTIVLMATPLLFSCSNGDMEPIERMVSVGSHSLHAVVVGSGSPVVVFDGGIGALCDEYKGLQDRIAATTTVVVYDRAGYGASEVGPRPRDSRCEVEELRTLLSGLGVRRPYVIVGHSLGALNAQIYAGLYPEEIAGVVLLDPPPLSFIRGEDFPELFAIAEQMTDEWQAIADAGTNSDVETERAEAGFFEMLASEHRQMLATSARQASSISSFGDTPLIVVASGVPNRMFGDLAGDYQQYWAVQSQALSKKSSRGQFVLAQGSTHRLHEDAEDLVVESIMSLVKSARASRR